MCALSQNVDVLNKYFTSVFSNRGHVEQWKMLFLLWEEQFEIKKMMLGFLKGIQVDKSPEPVWDVSRVIPRDKEIAGTLKICPVVPLARPLIAVTFQSHVPCPDSICVEWYGSRQEDVLAQVYIIWKGRSTDNIYRAFTNDLVLVELIFSNPSILRAKYINEGRIFRWADGSLSSKAVWCFTG